MKIKFLILIIINLLSIGCIFPQAWKLDRQNIGINIGMTNFLGDLGGSKTIGQPFIYDIDIQATRPLIGLSYNYRLDKISTLSTQLNFGYLRGDDKFTKNPVRNNRNLNFRSPILELVEQFELSLYNSSETPRYNLKSSKGRNNYEIYIFVGIGVFWFNPQGRAPDGRWYNLKPLSTEGQGLSPEIKKYSNFQVTIPYGLGFRYKYNRQWAYGFAIGPRATFTDYIDDCSTVYFDNDIIRSQKGDIAAYFADPSKGEIAGQTLTGEQRGDPKDKDSYIFAYFTINYNLGSSNTHRSNLPKFY
jgi:hypothetical protein